MGAVQRIFKIGDIVRVKVKTLTGTPASKLKPQWSEPYEVVKVFDVNVELKNPSDGLLSRVHFDRLSHVIPKLKKEIIRKNAPASASSS